MEIIKKNYLKAKCGEFSSIWWWESTQQLNIPLFACCWPCCPVIYKLSSNDWLAGWQAESSLLQEAEDSDANIFFPSSAKSKGAFSLWCPSLFSDVQLDSTPFVAPAGGDTRCATSYRWNEKSHYQQIKAQTPFIFIHFDKLKKGTIFFFQFHFMKTDSCKCHSGTLIVRVNVDVLL